MPSSTGSSQPRDQIQVSQITASLPLELPGEAAWGGQRKKERRKKFAPGLQRFFSPSFPSFNFFLPTPTLSSFSPFPPAFLSLLGSMKMNVS